MSEQKDKTLQTLSDIFPDISIGAKHRFKRLQETLDSYVGESYGHVYKTSDFIDKLNSMWEDIKKSPDKDQIFFLDTYQALLRIAGNNQIACQMNIEIMARIKSLNQEKN